MPDGVKRRLRDIAMVRRLSAPTDIASLVVFRVCFGAILVWECYRYIQWIEPYYITPDFHFTYYGFEWVRPLPGEGMYWYFGLMALLAFCVGIGLFYRLSASLLFCAVTYFFLLDQSRYLNHVYLVCIISFLMIFVPAHKAGSIDSWRRPSLRSESIPGWSIFLLRAQIGLVYFYGGLAKLNVDWLRGEPMRTWLGKRSDFTLLNGTIPIGRWFTEEWVVYFYSYGGIAFDLFIVPLLIWKRTRIWALAVAVMFHLSNAWMFTIGIFPWFMIGATLLFLSPDWPRRVLNRPLRQATPTQPMGEYYGPVRLRGATALGIGAFLLIQLLVPFRHVLYPGSVHWTEEGHRFSWHMKLRYKEANGAFVVTLPSGKEEVVRTRMHLSDLQCREMIKRPDMILQYCHFLADDYRKKGLGRVAVRALVAVSLNGRNMRWLINPQADLASQPRNLRHASWILGLHDPRGVVLRFAKSSSSAPSDHVFLLD